MKTIRAWFTKGLLVSMVWAVMGVGIAPGQAEGQSLVPIVTVSSSLSPASGAGPVTFTPAALSPRTSSLGTLNCYRCFCFTGEPPHWSECQGEYGYDCLCEGCNFPGPDCIDFESMNGAEICESYIVGGCGGSGGSGFGPGGEGDCGCACVADFDRESIPYDDCEFGGGGSAALLDGTRLYSPSSPLPSGTALFEGQQRTTIALHPGLTWQAVPGMGDVVRSRCDDTVVARIYTPERAASVRAALSVLSL